MNWAATAVNMIIPFFLTPFVVHHLGRVQYGVWILAVSIVSYLALLDLGLRSAVVRFVSRAHGRGQPAESAASIQGALWMRLLIALTVVLLSFVLAAGTRHLFHIPQDLLHAARITVLLCGFGVASSLVSGVFGAVLTGIHRFDVLSSITMTQTTLRACGVLWLLLHGHGLVALAVWELAVILLAGLLTVLLALRLFPAARIRVGRPPNAVLRALWSYSATTFIFMIAVQVVINTDTLVIGAFLSVGMVTYYAIGSSLVNYSTQVASAVSSTFIPLASQLEGSSDPGALRDMLLRGTQAMLGLVLPIALTLFFRGRTFIDIWMGPQYGVISETVLRILMISLFFSMGDSTAGAIMMALDKHKPVARWAVYEAVLNLALSLALVKTIGLYGVAWGTSLSMAFTHLAFWPRYNAQVLGVPVRTYLWQGWGKISLAALPYAFFCVLTEHFWQAHTLVVFFAQVLAILPVYLVSVLILYRREARGLLQSRARARLLKPA